ncbi:hypothetical protein ACHAWF_005475 [Thalassiosira exigua]
MAMMVLSNSNQSEIGASRNDSHLTRCHQLAGHKAVDRAWGGSGGGGGQNRQRRSGESIGDDHGILQPRHPLPPLGRRSLVARAPDRRRRVPNPNHGDVGAYALAAPGDGGDNDDDDDDDDDEAALLAKLGDAICDGTRLERLCLNGESPRWGRAGRRGGEALEAFAARGRRVRDEEQENERTRGRGGLLKSLTLRRCKLSDGGAEALISTLTSCRDLEYVRLAECRGSLRVSGPPDRPGMFFNYVLDKSVPRLVDALRGRSNLRTLDLGHNDVVGADGCEALAALLRDPSCYLVALGLENDLVDFEGASHLADALRTNNTLRDLHLNGNPVLRGRAGARLWRGAVQRVERGGHVELESHAAELRALLDGAERPDGAGDQRRGRGSGGRSVWAPRRGSGQRRRRSRRTVRPATPRGRDEGAATPSRLRREAVLCVGDEADPGRIGVARDGREGRGEGRRRRREMRRRGRGARASRAFRSGGRPETEAVDGVSVRARHAGAVRRRDAEEAPGGGRSELGRAVQRTRRPASGFRREFSL